MTFLPSLRVARLSTATVYAATVCAATCLAGAVITGPPALAIPISGVTSWNAGTPDGGPRRPGAIRHSAGTGSASVAKGRPTGASAPSPSSDRLHSMKR